MQQAADGAASPSAGEPAEMAATVTTTGGLSIQRLPLGFAVAVFVLVAIGAAHHGWHMVLLALVGLLLGVTLYHASFGFANGYRRMIVHRDVRGVQAQLLMLALAIVLFAPVLASDSAFGRPIVGAWAPIGVSVGVGAFLFGIGMQLAGGCGSGTLYTAGGGSLRMLIVLVAAVAGSFWASLHVDWWWRLPSYDAIVLGRRFGWPTAVALQLGFIAALSLGLRLLARPVPAQLTSSKGKGLQVLWTGPWPLALGAALLALGNVATLLIDGSPWSITWGFTLWGAKSALLFGWDPATSWFWRDGSQHAALNGDLLADSTSLMDISIMLGALAAAALATRFAPQWRMAWGSLAAALLGGLAIGYGARIAYGCNIGAFFSGVASGSLHGWLWIAAALPGTWLGIGLRRRFGLPD